MRAISIVEQWQPIGAADIPAPEHPCLGSCRCGARWDGHAVCHCGGDGTAGSGCHLSFTSVSAFDEHRAAGVCRTPQELRERGLDPKSAGLWRRPRPEHTLPGGLA